MGKKRANSEGSIRKRKDSRWEGFYTASYDPAPGKQKIKNVLGKTQAEIKEKLKKAIADSQRLDMNRSGTHTVKSWVTMWYEVYAEPRLRENTKDYYLNYINNHIIPQLGDIKLDKLTTIQIQKFYNDLQKNGRVQRYQHIQLKNKGLSVRVVHGIHTLLNNCLEQAVAERLILVNPARGRKLPKMEKREMKVLPEEKIRPYLMEADKRGLLAPFYLELTTGLRRGELLALLWTDLDVEKRTISITKQVTRTKGELVVSQPKTHNSIRVLPVSQQAVELLVEEHKKHPGNPYMFPSPKTGGMFDPDSLHVPVAQDEWDVRSGLLSAYPREDSESHRRGAYPVPRSSAYLRNAVSEERGGCEDPVQYPGTLQCGLHSQHLHPRHAGYDAGGSGYDGRCNWKGDVTIKINIRQHWAGKFLPGAAFLVNILSVCCTETCKFFIRKHVFEKTFRRETYEQGSNW